MPAPSYKWDPEKRRYIDADGNTVSEPRVRGWVDKLTVASALGFIARALLVGDGKLNPRDWAHAMSTDITSLHTVVSIVAAGGVQQTTDEFWSHAATEIAIQQDYFKGFSDQVIAQAVDVTADAFPARNALYAEAGFSTYENAVAIREFGAGLDLYKRVLAGNEPDDGNCIDCLEYEQLGWQTRGQLPRIGDSRCRTRCRCHFEFKQGTLAEVGTGSVSRLAPIFLPPSCRAGHH